MEFEILNTPIPESDSIRAMMLRLEIGQSFIVPFTGARYQRGGLYASAASAGVFIATRLVEDGIQVWRIKDKTNDQGK